MSEGLPLLDAEHPWPGLFPYGEEAHAYFNGRERETIDLLRLVRRDALTLLYGQSGLGKSSLLRAGLFPRLREEALLPIYIRLEFRNRTLGLREQTWNIVRVALSSGRVDGRPPRDDESLWAYFHAVDVELWDASNRMVTPVLVFDQFEEIVQAGEERELAPRLDAFMEELADLVENRVPADVTTQLEHDPDMVAAIDFNARRFRCVIGFREDFLPDLEQRFVTHNLSTQSRLRITKMGEEQALAAVEKTGGRLVDREVAQRIVQFVSAATGRAVQRFVEIEPALLSVVCFELNNRRLAQHEERISADLLAGAQEQIIAEFYERSVADLDPAVQVFIERELLTESGYRDSCAVDDAVQRHGIPRDALQTLVDRRVLRLEERFGVVRVELTHDVLTPVVRERRDRRQAVEVRERERQREAARIKRSRTFMAVGGSLMGVAAVLVIVFFNLFRQAEKEKARVIEAQSTLFLSRANASLENNIPAEPVRYLAQAVALNPRNEGAIARLASLANQRNFARKVWEKEFGQSGDSTGTVVALDGDGFAFMSTNSSWRFAKIVSAKPHPSLRESCVITRPAKGDAGALASFTFESMLPTSPVGAARIADTEVDLLAGNQQHDELAKLTSRCAVTPNRKSLDSLPDLSFQAIEAGSGAVWAMAGRDLSRIAVGDASRETISGLDDVGEIARVFPAPGGQAVIIAGDNAAVMYAHVKDARGAGAFARTANLVKVDPDTKQLANVRAAVFDGTGKLALIAFENGVCQLWETSTAKKRWSRACGRDVHAFVPGKPWVALSGLASGARAAGGSNGTGGQIEIVSLADGQVLGVVRQAMAVNHIAFSPAGDFAVVASQDRTAKVYQLPKLAQVGASLLHEGAVVEAHFRSPDAQQVVTASFDGSARVWEWQTGRMIVEPMLHPGPVLFARPVMNGAYVLSLGDDRRLRLWRVDPAAGVTESSNKLILQPAVSPSGNQLAYLEDAADSGGTGTATGPKVMLAHVAGEPTRASPLREAKPVYAASGAVMGMYFSLDNRLLAVAGRDPWLAIVRIPEGAEQRMLRLPAPVERAVFSPGGELVVVQLADDSLRIIDLATGRQSGLSIKLSQAILDFGISNDGKWLSVATGVQLQVYDLRTAYPVAQVVPGGIVTAAVHPLRAEIAFATRTRLTLWRPALDPRGVKKISGDTDQPEWLRSRELAAREVAKGEGVVLHLKKLLVGLRYTPDGAMLAAFSIDGLATTWDTTTLAQGPQLRHSSTVVSMGMSDDGRWLTTTTLDGLARIWDHRTGQLMTDALNLQDSERDFRVLGAGTWALVQAAGRGANPSVANGAAPGAAAPAPAGFELRMLGLGFAESPPAWFVPTVTAMAGAEREAAVAPAGGEKSVVPAAGWWESWLRYVATRNGVTVR